MRCTRRVWPSGWASCLVAGANGVGHDAFVHLDPQIGVVAIVLLVAVAGLLAIAPMLRIPYPILLVLGGLAIGLVPEMPEFELEPELVFFGVLPVLLYARRSSPRSGTCASTRSPSACSRSGWC